MVEKSGIQKLKMLDQEQLLDGLEPSQIREVLKQIDAIDEETLRQQQKIIEHPPEIPEFKPFTRYELSGNKADQALGSALIAAKKVGCIILAGGQGTRLGFGGPKGAFVIPGINKTLFQILAARVLGPLAIMTSPKNDADTQDYWAAHNFFNLSDVRFFQQSELPFLDEKGNLFLEDNGVLATGPNGNGTVYHDFVKSGILADWEAQGIEIIQIILVDNALAQPFDAELIGYHRRKKSDVTLKCTPRLNADEKVGVLVESNQGVKILEYTELGDKREGDFLANLSLMCFDIKFLKKIADQQLPLHKSFKKCPYWDVKQKKQIIPNEPNVWKFEYFSFDALPYATRVEALACPRETCFAPLKNATGADSPETVSLALQKELK
jgi:UDP-N-acetylglucosamine/UDP-N-acetylgalactosamine diphosphorylase